MVIKDKGDCIPGAWFAWENMFDPEAWFEFVGNPPVGRDIPEVLTYNADNDVWLLIINYKIAFSNCS